MSRTEVGRITVGAVYRYHGLRVARLDGGRLVERIGSGLYRVEAFVLDGMTRRDMVLYSGLDGSDQDHLFVCPCYDFALKFHPAVVEETPAKPPAEPPPEKPAPVAKEGSEGRGAGEGEQCA